MINNPFDKAFRLNANGKIYSGDLHEDYESWANTVPDEDVFRAYETDESFDRYLAKKRFNKKLMELLED